MAETVLPGASASPGRAAGAARLLGTGPDPGASPDGPSGGAGADPEEELARARAALEAAAARLEALAGRAQAGGEDAEILEANALMARDPGLMAAAEAEIRTGGFAAPAALVRAAEAQAAVLDGLDDPTLAARAADVRSIGRRAAELVPGAGSATPAEGGGADAGTPTVLVSRDLGPADVAELADDVEAIALAAGAVTAHAAIVARGRGLPMVVAAGDALLAARPGADVVVDGDRGEVVLDPAAGRLDAARAATAERLDERQRSAAAHGLPAVTTDGRALRVLANAAGAAEVRAGLEAGAEGAGLVRTELAFLEATDWPGEEEHERVLAPILAALPGRVATVRVFDFGGDKTPPFLEGTTHRGLELLLGAPEAFTAQVRAIMRCAGDADLRLLLPMVRGMEELTAARELVARAASSLGAPEPPVGAMIETADGVDAVGALAAAVAFLSIGTNDLTHALLGSDRFTADAAATNDPRVLGAIERVVDAAHAAGLVVEVCGEAASDPATFPLLLGLGVDELSVGAARVGLVRAWVREASFADCRELAHRALAPAGRPGAGS
jgi:multiphosphoryl transfer protein